MSLLSVALLSAAQLGACDRHAAKRHAVVVVVDTVRADAMAAADTPSFDALVKAGQSPELAWAPATWTAPSVMSMLTGASVRAHGWDLPFPSAMPDPRASYPPMADLPTLPAVLGQAGFETVGFYGNVLLGRELELERGFSRWAPVHDSQVVQRVRHEVEGWSDGRRHFLYVHLYGAHQPLSPSLASRRKWGFDDRWFNKRRRIGLKRANEWGDEGAAQYRKAYHAVIEDLDGVVGRLHGALGKYAQDTVFIVTSDHGEMLGEHGAWGHDASVWEPVTAVPFVAINAPPLPDRLSTAAIPDIVTRAVGVTAQWPTTIDGDAPLVVQREGRVALTTDGRRKGVWAPEVGESAVFDLVVDPDELSPILGVDSALAAARRDWERAVPQGSVTAVAAPMSDEMLEALRELGYLDDAPPGIKSEPPAPAP